MVSKLMYVNHRAFWSWLHDAHSDRTTQNIKLSSFQTWVKLYFQVIFFFFLTCSVQQVELIFSVMTRARHKPKTSVPSLCPCSSELTTLNWCCQIWDPTPEVIFCYIFFHLWLLACQALIMLWLFSLKGWGLVLQSVVVNKSHDKTKTKRSWFVFEYFQISPPCLRHSAQAHWLPLKM